MPRVTGYHDLKGTKGKYAELEARMRASVRPLTPEERRQQRISFAYDMGGRQGGLTREQVAKIIDENG